MVAKMIPGQMSAHVDPAPASPLGLMIRYRERWSARRPAQCMNIEFMVAVGISEPVELSCSPETTAATLVGCASGPSAPPRLTDTLACLRFSCHLT
jgi:hypothetical protein